MLAHGLPGSVGRLVSYLQSTGRRKQSYLVEFEVTVYPRGWDYQTCRQNLCSTRSMLVQRRQQWYLHLNGQCFGAGTRLEFVPSESTAA